VGRGHTGTTGRRNSPVIVRLPKTKVRCYWTPRVPLELGAESGCCWAALGVVKCQTKAQLAVLAGACGALLIKFTPVASWFLLPKSRKLPPHILNDAATHPVSHFHINALSSASLCSSLKAGFSSLPPSLLCCEQRQQPPQWIATAWRRASQLRTCLPRPAWVATIPSPSRSRCRRWRSATQPTSRDRSTVFPSSWIVRAYLSFPNPVASPTTHWSVFTNPASLPG
jgi:hypothetical protein